MACYSNEEQPRTIQAIRNHMNAPSIRHMFLYLIPLVIVLCSNMAVRRKHISAPYLLRCILSLIPVTSSSAFILRNACELSGEFSVVKHDFVLNSTIIATLYNKTYYDCKFSCIGDRECKSFNAERKERGGCQLVANTTEDSNDSSLIRREGWTFYSTSYKDTNIGKHCQQYKPCRQGQICISTCSCPGYRCHDNCTTMMAGVGYCPKVTGSRNCALRKNATLTSSNQLFADDGTRGIPSNAVNGIYEKEVHGCALSAPTATPHRFMVDLGADFTIDAITVNGVCMDSVAIEVDGTSQGRKVCKSGVVISGYQMRTFTCDSAITGRYVYLKTVNSPITLCELEVVGNC